jgi:hypothetical protein
MEDALPCNSDSMVVGVDRFWVVRAADADGVAERRGEGVRSLCFAERAGRLSPSDRLAAVRSGGVTVAAKDLFAAEFFQIVNGVAGPYGDGLCLLSARIPGATSEAVNPLGEGDSASTTWRIPGLLRSMRLRSMRA